jgi:DNA-directed RNA polymerase specialized sigma24 family protein
MAKKQPVQVVVPGSKNIYLSNRELLAEVKKAKKKGEMSNQLARMLQMLCSRYAKKGNFINYTYNEDMQAYAMMMLVRTWNSFNPEKSSNPFAFFTQCIKNSFIQYLNQEKRQRNIRDLVLVDQGLNPSYGFDQNAGRVPVSGEDDAESAPTSPNINLDPSGT